MKIYLDTMIVIYIVENIETYSEKFISKYLSEKIFFVTSELTRLKCRVKPIKQNLPELLEDYDFYFGDNLSEVFPITRELIDSATYIRAKYGFKTPDSIHLAAAKINHSELFLTFDNRLKSFTEIKVEILD